MALGGSTNVVLHLIAMAHSVGINLTIDDFQLVSDRVPLLADLKPSGKYVMEDVNSIGGIPSVIDYLIKLGLMTGDEMTVTGQTLGENCAEWVEKHGSKWEGQKVMRGLDDPIKETGHIRLLFLLRISAPPDGSSESFGVISHPEERYRKSQAKKGSNSKESAECSTMRRVLSKRSRLDLSGKARRRW